MTFTQNSKTYKVKLVSQTSSIAIIILLLISFFIGMTVFEKYVKTFPVYLFIILFVLITYLVWQKYVTGRTEWTISPQELIIHWTKRPLERTKDLTLKLSDIYKISRGLDPHYYHLKITLISGQTLSFFHDSLTFKDDFSDLIETLYQLYPKK